MRSALLAARRAVPADLHRAEAEQLCGHLADLVVDIRTVCAYLPVGAEPGLPRMVDRLHEFCAVVLLPGTQLESAVIRPDMLIMSILALGSITLGTTLQKTLSVHRCCRNTLVRHW